MATNGIQVPVSLYIENLQKIINDLKGQLGNLKVGSSGFKAMENHIRTLQKELDKFQIQASKPFIAEGQFVAAEKSIDRLEDEIEKISLTAGRLKFSDLELNGEQKAQLKAVEDQINAIKASLKAAKDEARKNFLSSDLGKQWIDLNPSEATRTLDQITNNIRKAVDDQNKQVQRAKETVDEYKRTITMGDIAQNVAKSTKGLKSDRSSAGLEALMGKEFSDFFTKHNNGDVAGFKAGQRGFFAEWLTKNFTIDPTIVKDLVSKTAPEIARVLNDAQSTIRQELNKVIANADTAKVNLPAANVAVSDAEAKLQALIPYLQQAMQTTDGLKISEDLLREALTAAGITLENTKESIAANVRGSQEWSNVNQRATAELENLKNTLLQTNAQFLQQQRVTQNFNAMKMAVVNFMGFRQVLNLTKNAIREAINHIKELDSVMNKISIVTDMSTEDLWQQVDQYSKMAQAYGTTIKGAYEVSQIYYQQGLETNDVLTLTNETLKLAKVSGLDYATTTDYMTTALRGFKMEMSEASKVVDVYSNLAAHTAVSSEELAVAMSKTASSMESVGSTFEETSAMIGTMVAVTRESATNIGSALKSIASRYGEMKQDPLKLVDSEGDEISYNKVDAALQSVGITMKTVDGQFRSFTDVIIELSEKWEQLESTQQRYIATQFAGNRQQSRFLALVSNPQLLKANLGYAEESEDTGTLQALKALDSIESKLNQVQVAYQQFYTTMGIESVWKTFLDGATNVINTLNSFPKLFGKLPIGALAAVSNIITLIKSFGTKAITGIAQIIGPGILKGLEAGQGAAKQGAEGLFGTIVNTIKSKLGVAEQTGADVAQAITDGANKKIFNIGKLNKNDQIKYNNNQILISGLGTETDNAMAIAKANTLKQRGLITEQEFIQIEKGGAAAARDLANARLADNNALEQNILKTEESIPHVNKWATAAANSLQTFGSSLSMVSMMINTTKPGMKTLSGALMGFGGIAQSAGAIWQGFITSVQTGNSVLSSIPWMAVISGVFSVINGLSTLIITPEEKLEELEKRAEELNNKAKEAKANYRTLDNSVKKLDELKEKRYENAEAAEEYQTAVDELAAAYPSLIKSFDSMGNVILDASTMENTLTEARQKAAEAAYTAAKAEAARAKQELLVKDNSLGARIGSINSFINGAWTKTVALEPREDGRYNSIGARGTGDKLLNLLINNQSSLNDTEQALLAYINRRKEEGKGIGSGEILTGLLQDIATNARQENYTEAQDYIRLMRSAYEATGWKMPEEVEKLLTNITESIQGVIPLVDTINAANKQMVNSWLRSSKYSEISFVSSNSGLSSLFQSQLYEQANGDYSEAHLEKLAYELLQGPMQFWESLNEDEQALFDKMFSDTKNYTKNDFKQQFGEKAFFPAIENLLETYYNPDIAAIQKRANASLAQAMGKKADVNGNFEAITYNTDGITTAQKKLLWMASNNLTLTEEKFYNNVLSQYESLTKKGYNTRADAFAMASADLYGQIDEAPAEIEAQLWNIINENGLTTLEGIQKVKDQIAANSNLQGYISNDTLDILYNNIIPNINLAIQTATSDLLDTWEDTSKDLSAAMKGGISLKDADALIKKAESLGLENPITLDDFQLSGDKLILTRDAYKRYYEGLNTANEAAAKSWQEHVQAAEQWKTFMISRQSTLHVARDQLEQMRTDLAAIGFDYTQYLGEDGRITVEGVKALQDALVDSQEKLAYYNKAAQIAADQLNNAEDRRNGIYKLHTNDANALTKAELEDIVSDNDLGWEGDDVTKRAIKEDITSLYSGLISDVLAKGFKNINLKDYEGLIDGDTIELSGSYKDFAEKYAKLAGMTVDETNDLLLQAIEKDRETITEDLIKDLLFVNNKQFIADRSQLGKLANAFDVPLQKLLTAFQDSFNQATQEYIIDIDTLKEQGIDLEPVDNFKITVQESIDSMFNSISSEIKSALGGSLDAKGMQTLIEDLEKVGINTELQFIKTKEGYKLSTDQVETLYEELKKVDALSAQIVLDELNKSIDESVIGAKNLNKEIATLRATTESDDFKFMSGNIPSGQHNPLNYFGDWGKAWKTLQDSFKTSGVDKGKIGYEDFYRIMTEMGRIAQESGEPIQIGANKFVTDAESAAALIEEGAAALTVASDGSIKVDLTKFGMDFAAGGKDMLKGVDNGIKAVAKAQIKILDAEIAMLEAIVAMQELDIAGEDNKVDLSDIFDFDQGGKLQDKVSTLLTFLNTSIAEFSVGGKSLNEVLFSRLNPEELVQFFSQLNTIITDPDCDPATIKARITSLIQKFFPKDTVEVNDAIFGMLSFDKETLGPDLYNKIVEMLENKLSLSEASKQGVISKIKEKNKELGTLLETLLKQNSEISFATALKIAAEITQNGTITEKDGTWSYTYDGKTHGGYTTEALAKAAMEKEITDKYENTDYSSVISADGSSQNEITVLKNGTVVNKRTLSNGGTVYMVGDTPLTWDGTDQSLIDALNNSSIGENGDITFKDTKGRTITITSSGTVGYTCTVDDTTNTTTYTRNGKTLKCTTGSVKQTELDEFFAGERTFVDTISIDDEGNETPITLVRSVSGIEYDTSFDPTTRKYTINGQYASDTPEAAAKAYEAANPPTTQTTTEEDKGIKTFTWHYNGVAIEITYDEKTKTYSVNGTPIVGATTPDEAISQANQSGIIQLEDLQATQDVYVKQNIKTEEDEYDKLKRFLHGQKGHLFQDTVNEFGAEFGLTKTGDNYNVESDKQFANYINSLYEKAVNQKQVLTKTEQEIIGILKDTKGLYGHIDDDYYKKIEEISKANDYNLDNITTPLTELNQLFVSDNITSLNDALNNLLSTLSLLENVKLTQVIQSIKDIQTIINEDIGEGELTLNIKFTDDQKEAISNKIDELIQKIITPQTMPIIPDIDEEVIKNYTPPTKIMYIRQKILEASSASGNLGRKETNRAHYVYATGNVGDANAKGTLMGELGPELVVSNGRYFVAGQNGAEFVNLDTDAIVFNHLQTKSLLEKGSSSNRGRAITSEKKAVAYARGNINGGPAKVSPSDTLAQLKQLRAQWQALLNLSVQDFAAKGGGGGGGGDPKAFIKDLERWYNWLQRISTLEKEISLEESKRAEYQSAMTAKGKEYYTSQMDSLKKLQEQAAVQMSLNKAQEEYAEKRKDELNTSGAYRALYEFDPEGQLKYKTGKYEWLATLAGTDANGKPNYTAKEQYDAIVAAGFKDTMLYDSSGNKIKEDDYAALVQAFWDGMESERQEMQNLYDNVQDGKKKVVDLQKQQNDIMRDIEDNQIAVENKVLTALESARQREIDDAKKEKDAIQESTNQVVDGLNRQLEQERRNRDSQKSSEELSKLQRRLGILQRTGGSAAEIANLQQEISDKQYDKYFETQERQIQAMKDASDLQIQRLDTQIKIMEETLEYEKEHGLLWNEVYDILEMSPDEVANYIKENDQSYFGKSDSELYKILRDDVFEIERFQEFMKNEGSVENLAQTYGDETKKDESEKITKESEEYMKTSDEMASSTPLPTTSIPQNKQSEKTKQWHVGKDTKGYWTEAEAKTRKTQLIADAKKILDNPYIDPDRRKQAESALNQWKNAEIRWYDRGGMVDETGPAILHAKEAVLTARQTNFLRNDLLGNQPNSLLSFWTDMEDMKREMQSLYGSTTNTPVIIENATVEMNVSEIASDYDARRAGEQALDKILAIARKTSASNRVSR